MKQPSPMMSSFQWMCYALFLLTVVLAAAKLLADVLLSRGAADWAERIAFVLALSHAPAKLVGHILATLFLDKEGIPLWNLREMLRTSPQMNWPPFAIYLHLASHVFLLCLGLAMAIGQSHWGLYLLFASASLLWRMGPARRFLEAKGTPYFLERDPISPEERLYSWCSDLFFVLLFVALYLLTAHFIWILAATIFLAYWMLLKFGHHVNAEGPVGYVACLMAVLASALITCYIPELEAETLRRYSSAAIGAIAVWQWAGAAIDREIRLRERIIPIAIAASGFVLLLASLQNWGPPDFSQKAYLSAFAFDAKHLLAVVVVFLLTICLHAVVVGIGRKRKWAFPGLSKKY